MKARRAVPRHHPLCGNSERFGVFTESLGLHAKELTCSETHITYVSTAARLNMYLCSAAVNGKQLNLERKSHGLEEFIPKAVIRPAKYSPNMIIMMMY